MKKDFETFFNEIDVAEFENEWNEEKGKSFFFRKKDSLYNEKYKEIVIEKMLKEFFDDVDYVPKKQMPENIYKSVFESYYDYYMSDDYMDALIDNKYKISMADIYTASREEYEDINGFKEFRTMTIFSGIFAKINLGKSIKNKIEIIQNFGINGRTKVNMDSREFESFFDVYATDNIVAMQILTHEIMDFLVSFKKILNESYDVIIDNDCMYIRLHIGKMFESKLNSKELIDKQSTEKYYNIIDFIYVLSKELIEVIEETEI